MGGGMTFARSFVWASELRFWEDAWKKGPNKARTNKNYGFVLVQEGRVRAGLKRLERAVELEPQDLRVRSNLVSLYVLSQQWPKAWEAFKDLEAVDPGFVGIAEKKRLILDQLEE